MISELERNFLKTGFKEVLRILEKGDAEKVFIAEDISAGMKDKLLFAVSSSGCEVIYAKSMKELGKLCAIDVGASCAAVLKH